MVRSVNGERDVGLAVLLYPIFSSGGAWRSHKTLSMVDALAKIPAATYQLQLRTVNARANVPGYSELVH